jgi:hypothetical protein
MSTTFNMSDNKSIISLSAIPKLRNNANSAAWKQAVENQLLLAGCIQIVNGSDMEPFRTATAMACRSARAGSAATTAKERNPGTDLTVEQLEEWRKMAEARRESRWFMALGFCGNGTICISSPTRLSMFDNESAVSPSAMQKALKMAGNRKITDWRFSTAVANGSEPNAGLVQTRHTSFQRHGDKKGLHFLGMTKAEAGHYSPTSAIPAALYLTDIIGRSGG